MKKTKWFGLLAMILAFIIAMPSAVMANNLGDIVVPNTQDDGGGYYDDKIRIFSIYQTLEDCCSIDFKYVINGKNYSDSYDMVRDGYEWQNAGTVSTFLNAYLEHDTDVITEGTITITPKEGYAGRLITNIDTLPSGTSEKIDATTYKVYGCQHIFIYVFTTDASDEERSKSGSISVSAVDGCTFRFLNYLDKDTYTCGDIVDIEYSIDERYRPYDYFSIDEDTYGMDLELKGCELVWNAVDWAGGVLRLMITGDPNQASANISFINLRQNLGSRKPKQTGTMISFEGLGYVVTSDKTGSQTVTCTGKILDTKQDIWIPDYIEDKDGIHYWVTAISDRAFKDEKITEVTLFCRLKTVGSEAFANCSNLNTIYIIYDGMTASTIEKDAFKGIKKNCKIWVPRNVFKNYKKWLKKKGQSKIKVKRF